MKKTTAKKSEARPRFCVLGAGHGGMAMAGHLALMGYEVNLYNRSADRIEPIALMGGIQLSGVIEGFGQVKLATDDIEAAVDGVDILMVVVPATGHRFIAEKVAPFLRDGQVIVLNPGRTGGALEVKSVFRAMKVKADVVIGEAQTLLYASRNINPAQVKDLGIKTLFPLQALPGRESRIGQGFTTGLSQFVPGDNVLKPVE